MSPSTVRWTRIGPVVLEWSEWNPAARVIGEGGDDLYHCEMCPHWASGYDDALDHAALHGYYMSPAT